MTAHSDLHHTAQDTPGRSTVVVDRAGEVEHTPVPQKEPNQGGLTQRDGGPRLAHSSCGW